MDPSLLTLLAGALLLGLRHGIDWDHIAAILDIVGSSRPSNRLSPLSSEIDSLKLSLLYACGHGLVVAVLGVAALKFAAVLPQSLDGVMQRITGLTLLFLAAWVFLSLYRSRQGGASFRMTSRWMLVFTAGRRLRDYLTRRFGLSTSAQRNLRNYEPRTAFAIGMIHGIGAETGTQMLLLAAMGGSGSEPCSISMLTAFIAGLLISNVLFAWLAITGFMSTAQLKPVYVGTGVAFGVFSLVVGALLAAGLGAYLPEMPNLVPPLAFMRS